MTRPTLTKNTSPHDFASYYWLKEELAAFCRENGLSSSGAKQDLSNRILLFLQTGKPPIESNPPPVTRRKQQAEMPPTFTRQSIIGAGWRCSQELRAFFEQEIGKSFHFDGVMRDFIHLGVGKTLEEAITAWQAEQKGPRQPKEIAPQFEYNRHFREYFQLHPGASREEAIQAWKTKKAVRQSSNEANQDQNLE